MRPVDLARAWHGAGDDVPVTRLDLDEPDFPEVLIACGQLVRLVLQTPTGPCTIGCDSPDAYLAYDPSSPAGRLYIVLPDATKDEVLDALWTGDGLVDLDELARAAGGDQQGDYPEVEVQPLGAIVQVEYQAKKYGDFEADAGAVFFHVHENPLPWLAVDEDGRLFYAGGCYDGSDLRGIVG